MVPASFELKVYLGVVSFPGVVTKVTAAIVGEVVSIVTADTLNALLACPKESVTVMVQLL